MEINLYLIFLFCVVFFGVEKLIKTFTKKTVWIIEDSEDEEALLKIKLKNTERIHFIFKRNLKEITWFDLLFRSPDAVIADYMLEGSHRGDELIKYCARNSIPAILVTGYEGEIFDCPKIIKKGQGGEHIESINSWVERKILV